MPLGNLIASCGGTVPAIAEKMEIDKTLVMAWVCGEVPDSLSAIRLAEILDTSLEKLYLAILHTPNLMV